MYADSSHGYVCLTMADMIMVGYSQAEDPVPIAALNKLYHSVRRRSIDNDGH